MTPVIPESILWHMQDLMEWLNGNGNDISDKQHALAMALEQVFLEQRWLKDQPAQKA